MDPITLSLIAQFGISAVGEILSRMDKDKARALMQQALDRFGSISLPNLQAVIAEQVGPSAAGQVTADPALKSAQMSALSRLGGIVDGGGLSQADRIGEQQMLDQAALTESAGRGRIDEQMQARGMGNSGSALAMQMQNQQGAADRASQQSMDLVKQAQQRYLQAITQQGQTAGQMRGQDFGEKFQAAQARDTISRYNAAAREKAKYYNAGLPQQMYDDQMKKAGAQAQMTMGMANTYNQDAGDEQKFWGGQGVAAHEALMPRPKYRRMADGSYQQYYDTDPSESGGFSLGGGSSSYSGFGGLKEE